MRAAYLDASAAVKLFKPEPESAALADALTGYELWVSSEVVAVESACAARRVGEKETLAEAAAVVARLELVRFTSELRTSAASAFAKPLRALDAIHLATALALRDRIDAFVVYDLDLIAAAAGEGLPILRPAQP